MRVAKKLSFYFFSGLEVKGGGKDVLRILTMKLSHIISKPHEIQSCQDFIIHASHR
jgi:hypothetical protein